MSLAGFAVLLPDALGPTFPWMPEACLLPVRLKLVMPGQAVCGPGLFLPPSWGFLAMPVSALLCCSALSPFHEPPLDAQV